MESHCMRCRRPNPESAEGVFPAEWEVVEDDSGEVVGVICEGCVTGHEQQLADEAGMDVAAEVEARRAAGYD